MQFPGFCGPSYQSQARAADTERTINWYMERMEVPGAKAQWTLYPCPGLTSFATVTHAPGRAIFAQDGRCFAVIGFAFYELHANGTQTLRGTVNSDGLPATISSSGDAGAQLFITAGGVGYLYNLTTNVLTTVLSSGADVGGYLDGYFLSLSTASSTLRISDLLNGAIWDPTQIALRTAGSDKWTGMTVAHREVWLYGSETTEIWYNAGSFPFPFAPIAGAYIEQGLGARFSLARVDHTPIWLSRNDQGSAMVLRANGYGTPARISNHAVEFAMQGYATISDAVAFSYQDQGHSFYVLTFPAANATWVYDATTNLWHERLFWDRVNAEWDAYRPLYHANAFGAHLVLDRATGAIYRMAVDVYTDADGLGMRRVRRAPHLSSELRPVFYQALQIDLQTGVGLSGGQGSDPQLMMRWSDDGGATFGNEHWVSAGKMGEYKARAIWRRLGRARDRVFELSVSDPVPFQLIDASLQLEAGR